MCIYIYICVCVCVSTWVELVAWVALSSPLGSLAQGWSTYRWKGRLRMLVSSHTVSTQSSWSRGPSDQPTAILGPFWDSYSYPNPNLTWSNSSNPHIPMFTICVAWIPFSGLNMIIQISFVPPLWVSTHSTAMRSPSGSLTELLKMAYENYGYWLIVIICSWWIFNHVTNWDTG